MADGEGLFGLAKQVVPPQARFFAQAMFGDKTKPFTQSDLTPEELRQLNIAIENSRQRLQTRIEQVKNAKSYSDVSMGGIYPEFIENNPALKSEKEKFKAFKEFNTKRELQLIKGYGNVQYEDYPANSPIRDTLGRFTYQIQPDGSVHVSDKYDFYNESRAKNVEAFEKMTPSEKALTVMQKIGKPSLDEASNLGGGPDFLRSLAGRVGEAYIGRNGRPVDIRYDPSVFQPPPSVDNFQSPMYTDPFGNTIR
tara:strand:+ start:40 stop:795 length:756 start_codon:yes stop_codon:yes gene_type:complete